MTLTFAPDTPDAIPLIVINESDDAALAAYYQSDLDFPDEKND